MDPLVLQVVRRCRTSGGRVHLPSLLTFVGHGSHSIGWGSVVNNKDPQGRPSKNVASSTSELASVVPDGPTQRSPK